MDIWESVGYSANPYSVEPLPPTPEGAELLVGREKELRQLTTQLRSTDTHPTIEGDNGVGKTSLVFVAGFRAADDFVKGKTAQLLLPITEAFQIDSDHAKFERAALSAILNGYIAHERKLEDAGLFVPNIADIETWIRKPVLRGGGGGGSVLGVGASVSSSETVNTGQIFTEAGLLSQVREWLASTFPSRKSGAFVAVIDNLELLQTSKQARQTLEAIRDGVLALPGVRWVLCGAKGIIRSAVSSPRLSGRISLPIELSPIGDDLIPELMRRRLHHFSERPDPNAPVDAEGFGHLYRILNSNLRNALRYAQDFATWLAVEDELESSQAEKRQLLEVWMAEAADQHEQALPLQPAQWKLLDSIAESGGSIAPGDHQRFGFNSPQAMRSHLHRLEEANMVDTIIDETDSRRKTISITSVGWLVRYRRSGFQSP